MAATTSKTTTTTPTTNANTNDSNPLSPSLASGSELSDAAELKLVLFVLKSMKEGKAISQSCHAIHELTMRLEQEYFQVFPITDRCMTYKKWCDKPTKIVLKATAEELVQIANDYEDAIVIVDHEGDQYIPPGTLVCVALFPRRADQCQQFKDYKLF